MKVGSTSKIVACVRIKTLCPGIRLWLAMPLVVGTTWVDLDSKLETETLTKILIMKLQRSNANAECSVATIDNKMGNQINKAVDKSPINSEDSTKPPVHTAFSKSAVNNPQSNKQTTIEHTYRNNISTLFSESKGSLFPVLSADKLQGFTEDEIVIHHDYLNVPISELEESIL